MSAINNKRRTSGLRRFGTDIAKFGTDIAMCGTSVAMCGTFFNVRISPVLPG